MGALKPLGVFNLSKNYVVWSTMVIPPPFQTDPATPQKVKSCCNAVLKQKKLSSQRWTKSYFAMACSNGSKRKGGNKFWKRCWTLLHHFLTNFRHAAVEYRTSFLKEVASFLTYFCDSRCRRPACTAMCADPLKLCISWHWTCKSMSLDALFKLGPDSGRS